MSPISSHLAASGAVLKQAELVLSTLELPIYSEPLPPVARSGIGGHIRHVLDFYDCFLRGLPARRVDYEARTRNTRLEQDPGYAAERIGTLRTRLDELGAPCAFTPLLVRAEGAGRAGSPGEWGRSSVGRELEFLLSHTIHHFALVAMLLRLRGIEPGDTFGVAPSTLAHWSAAS